VRCKKKNALVPLIPLFLASNTHDRIKMTSCAVQGAAIPQQTWVIRKAGASKRSAVRCPAASAAGVESSGGVERRRVLFGAASLAAASTLKAEGASAVELSKKYEDEEDKFSFSVPQDWELATGDLSPNPQSARRVVAFTPPGSPEINGASCSLWGHHLIQRVVLVEIPHLHVFIFCQQPTAPSLSPHRYTQLYIPATNHTS
jgi:hypothetical protein